MTDTSPMTSPLDLVKPIYRKHRNRLIIGLLALLAVDFCQLMVPRVIKHAIDSLGALGDSIPNLAGDGLIILFLALGIAVMRFFWRYCILGFSRILERDLRQQFFAHLLTLDRHFYQHRSTGSVMALATNDLTAVQMAGGIAMVAAIDAVVMTAAVIGFMLLIHPMLTIIAVIPMPLLALITKFLSTRVHTRFTKVQEQFSRLTEYARNGLSAIAFIKAYGREKRLVAGFDQLGSRYVADNLKLARIHGTLLPSSGFIANISLFLVLFFGGRLTIEGTISTGDFVAFISYLYLLTWPMMAFGWVANLFQRGYSSLQRLLDILRQRPKISSPAHPQNTGSGIQGAISVENLSFTYPNQHRPALKNISIALTAGLHGIVGKTGSGKTTLCHLLTRQFAVDNGTIFFDAKDVNTYRPTDIYAAIAYVPQDVVLFSDTIANNIAMGIPEATEEQITAAARKAAIHDEIIAMEKGYDTLVGERGIRLSGGQRQRIGLARALILDRPVLIIDDGLSAVDMETESRIVQSLARIDSNKTRIIISNRISPLIDADQTIVLDQGTIVGRGNHQELIDSNPWYNAIYRHQMGING